MKHVPWCDVEGVISVMTPKELDYVECLWEAWKPHEIRNRKRFFTMARGRMSGMTQKSLFEKLGVSNSGVLWRVWSFEARRFCRARRLFWNRGVVDLKVSSLQIRSLALTVWRDLER